MKNKLRVTDLLNSCQSMNITDAKQLSAALSKWAAEEMHFKTVGLEDVKKVSANLVPLCKGSAMVKLWNEIIIHAKNKRKAGEIRENLELEELVEEGRQFQIEVDEQKRELEILSKDVDSLELHLNKCKQDLQLTNLKLSNRKDQDALRQIRVCLLKKYSESLNSKNTAFKSFEKWFEELCAVYQKNFESKESCTATGCGSELEEICSLLQDNFTNLDETLKSQCNSSDETWTSVGHILGNFSPSIITASMQVQTENATSGLKEDEENIDFVADLKKLEDKYCGVEGEGVNLLATVRKMLQQWDIDCLKSYNRSLICKKDVDNMTAQSESIRQNIITFFEKIYEGNPSNLQLAIDALDAEIELATFQGCSRSFHSSAARLQQEINKKSQAQERLVLLREKIINFSQILEINQKQIIAITSHNSKVKSKLCERQKDVLEGAQTNICCHRNQLSKKCTELQSSIRSRMVAFSRVDIAKIRALEMSDGRSVPLQKLSINRYSDVSNQAGGTAYQRTFHALGVHSHASPSSLITRIANMRREMSEIEKLREVDVLQSSTEVCKLLRNLENEGITLEKQQIKTLGQKYRQGVEIVKSAVGESNSLAKLTEIWYEQPGQYQTPWVKVEGLSLLEWKKKIENS